MKKEKPIYNIYIGSLIKAKATEKGISETQLAKLINCHISNIHYLYQRKCINTDQLWLIAEALEYDFFTEIYGKSLPERITNKQESYTTTIVVSSEKVTIERKSGISQITEYIKKE
jgi:hypothetical protein